jgi:hypothetical protein
MAAVPLPDPADLRTKELYGLKNNSSLCCCGTLATVLVVDLSVGDAGADCDH